MPGPAPEPTAVKRLKGNPGKRALNTLEPLPATGEPVQPDWLSDTAKLVWARLVEEMSTCPGLLTIVDGGALAKLCSLEADWLENEEQLKQSGQLYKDPASGRVGKSPRLTIKQELTEQILILYRELGLTPSARTRLHVAPTKKAESPYDALFHTSPTQQ